MGVVDDSRIVSDVVRDLLRENRTADVLIARLWSRLLWSSGCYRSDGGSGLYYSGVQLGSIFDLAFPVAAARARNDQGLTVAADVPPTARNFSVSVYILLTH